MNLTRHEAAVYRRNTALLATAGALLGLAAGVALLAFIVNL